MIGGAEMLTVAIVPKWFVRRRGRAVAIATTGTAMGPLFFPFLVHGLISAVGWRDAWMALGFLILAVMVPLSFLIRSRPEDIGLLPDGDTVPVFSPGTPRAATRPQVTTTEAEASHAAARPAEPSMTRGEAVRTRSFWLLTLAFTLAMLGLGGFLANWIPYFEDIGFSPSVGAWAATAYGICSISIRLFWGVLAERFPVRYLMVAQGVVTALSVILFLNITNVPTLILAGGFHGLALGGFFIMRPLMIANYFGRANLGAINGILRPFITLSGAMSPLLVAGMFDIYGSYKEAFIVVMITWLAAAAVMYLAAPPKSQRSTAGASA